MRGAAIAVLLAFASACGGAGAVGKVRFHNRPAVWTVDDRRDVPNKPEERKFAHLLYFFDVFFMRTVVTDPMDLETPRRAQNVNSFDEVPNSSWFTNRIGVREVTVDEIRRGPNSDDGPVAPYTIKGTKVGGKSIGFIMKDARGVKYIVKFDEKEVPVMETASDVVVQRLLWALGYFVAEDTIFYFKRDELVLAADASVSDVFGNKRPMSEKDLEENLALVSRGEDGAYRALASKFLPGIPIGGFAQRGTRDDDPNDAIPHEHRREVRGLYAIYSWLQATDVKEDNTLDVWAADPEDENHHYVLHFLVDFGKSLGANASIPFYAPDGHEPRVSPGKALGMLLSFGVRKQPWEGVKDPGIRGVGHWDVEHYEPGGYRPQQPYRPFEVKDDLDLFWGAKLVMRLTPELIRAAVEQGKYDDPRAVDYVTETLIGRQAKLGRYVFSRVNPLDGFTLTGPSSLCFDDLLLSYGLAEYATDATTWTVTSYDYDGGALGWTAKAVAGAEHTACVEGFAPAQGRDGYTILRIDTNRGHRALAPVEVHLATDPKTSQLRIIGIERR